jgi:hypothetical protein
MENIRQWLETFIPSRRHSRRKGRAIRRSQIHQSGLVRIERLEERVVLDSSELGSGIKLFTVDPNDKLTIDSTRTGGSTIKAVGIDPGQIGAPDGGMSRVDFNDNRIEFIVRNNLVTMENGQQLIRVAGIGFYSAIAERFPAPNFNERMNVISFAVQQEINVAGLAQGATYALSWNGQTTTSLRSDSTGDDVRDALVSLSNIGRVGGDVAVSRSPDGKNYVVTFGGTTWFRPALLNVNSPGGVTVRPVTEVALTNRIVNQSLTIVTQKRVEYSTHKFLEASLNNPVTIAIDNSPFLTPNRFYLGLTTGAPDDGIMKLLGAIPIREIGGAFSPTSAFNVRRTGTGFRITDIGSEYRLEATKDGAGNSQPIGFKAMGLNFEVAPGVKAKLLARDAAQNQLELESLDDTLLATAPFEGGSITVRFLRDNGPLFKVDVGTGQVTLTKKFEFVSAQLGSFTIPASDAFKATYDAAAERFTFTINNLNMASPQPTGRARDGAPDSVDFTGLTQVFDLAGTGFTVADREQGYRYDTKAYGFTTNDQRYTFNGVAAGPGRDLVDVGTFIPFGFQGAGLNLNGSLATLNQSIKNQILRNVGFRQLLPENTTAAERERLASNVSVTLEGEKLVVSGAPFFVVVSLSRQNNNSLPEFVRQIAGEYRGIVANPVKMAVPSGTITITKGKLDPIVGLPATSFEHGETTINSAGNYVTTFESIRAQQGGGFKLAYYPLNTYDSDGLVNVPGNTFGLYGNQVPLSVMAAGVMIGGQTGTASLGDERTPGVLVTNAKFNRIRFPIPSVKVENLTFTAANVGSIRAMTLNLLARVGTAPKSYVIEGGAILQNPGGLFKSDIKVQFAGFGDTDGLRIFTDTNKYTMSFGIAFYFLVGNGTMLRSRGTIVEQNPTTRALVLKGGALLEFNATAPHTRAEAESGSFRVLGQQVRIGFDLPYASSFPANLLGGSTLNFFIGDPHGRDTYYQGLDIFDYYLVGRYPSQNPLRLTLTDTSETLGGTFKVAIGGGQLNGVIEPTSLVNSRLPASPLPLDFTPLPGEPSGYTLGGVLFEGLGKTLLTESIQLKYPKSTFNGKILAEGPVGSEPNVIEARGRHLTKGEIESTVPTTVGDIEFQNFVANYSFNATPSSWNFVGPGTFFGKPVNVGSPGADNPEVKIGGDPKQGFQLRTLKEPLDPDAPSFPLPSVVKLLGVSFNVGAMPQEGAPVDDGVSKTYTLKTLDYKVKVGNTELALSLEMKVKVSLSGVEVVSLSATGQQNTKFSIGNATFQVKSLTVAYDVADQAIEISGEAQFTFKAASGNVDLTVKLGTDQDPGLVIKDGAIDSLIATVDGGFELLKLSAVARGLTVAYKKENSEFAIYGNVGISTKEQGGVQVIKDLNVTLGNDKEPGILIQGGSLKALDFAINGEINLFKLTATPKDLRVRYKAADNQLQITGALSLTLAPKLTLTASLPGQGLLINTDTGKVEIKGLSLNADGNIKFGVMTIKGLHVDYEENNGNVTISAGAEIELPSGLAVGGSFKIINGRLDAISISFEKNPGILVANGLVNIFRLEVSVEGLSDLANFKFVGSVTASVGPLVKFGGESYALATVKGTIEITPQYLELRGTVDLVGGKLGNGTFEGRLTWSGTPRVTFNGNLNLARGAVRGTISAYADINGNVDFKGDIGVYVPNGVPLAGGVSLGRLQVELRVRPAEPPTANYVRFAFSDIAINAFRVPTLFGSIRIDFDRNVGFEFGARFFIPLPWPLPDINYRTSFRGDFKLFDGTRPMIDILAASGITGTPNGEIVYSALTPLPDGTTIDLYADHDDQGNDGLLIASSLPYRAGTQSFVWEDMSTFAAPGEPIYVYAVISDGDHSRAFSDYSSRFNMAPGFVPTLTKPTSVKTGLGDAVVFSTAKGRRIVVGDPRSTSLPNSELEVVLSTAKGTVDLPTVPDNVRYDGNGTNEFTLRGTAAALNAALDGLFYTPDIFGDAEPDAIEITVRALPEEGVEPVRGKIDVTFETVQLFVDGSNAGLESDGVVLGLEAIPIIVSEAGQTPLDRLEINDLNTEFITGATVKINNFEMGQELLALPMNEHFATGLEGHFDHNTGVLTLSGIGRIADYLEALSNVVFDTRSMTAGKSLTVSLLDHEGDRGQITLPLQIVAGHAEPDLSFSLTGLSYLAGSGPQAIAPDAFVDVADDSTIQSITIAFGEGSYVGGEDVLAYAGTDFTADFDNDIGVLTLTGTGTEAAWNTVLQQVTYQSLNGGSSGFPVTAGPRYLQVTVEDSAESMQSSFLVIDVSETAETHAKPVLTLSTTGRTLDPNEEMFYLDPELTLTSEAPRLVGATVAFVDGYIPGEFELAVSSLWDGMNVEFDPLTGVLTISGSATTFEYEDVLRSVSVLVMAGQRTADSIALTFSVRDGLSATESEPFSLQVVSAPFLSAMLDNVITYTDGRDTEAIHDGFVIQHDGNLTGATVTISAGHSLNEDELLFTSQSGITGSFDAPTGVLTLTGDASTAAYETALNSVAYRSSRFNPVAGDRIISFQVQTATVSSNVSDAYISVEPIIVPPQVTIGATLTYTEDGAGVAIAPNFSLAARDAATPFGSAPEMLYGAEIDVTNWVSGEDDLTFTPTANITGTYYSGDGRIELAGPGTFDEYEAVIRGILYRNTSQAPTTTPRNVSIRLLDSGANGLENQTFSTQVVVGTPDPITITAGLVETIHVMANEEEGSLGLGDLQFASEALVDLTAELRFMPTQLPDDLLGRVVLADGTPVSASESYPISELGGLMFEPAEGGLGTATFTFSVLVGDTETDHLESEGFSQTVQIAVDGIATTTPSAAFVAQAYRELLHRNPDAATLADLAGQLDQRLRRVGRDADGFFDAAAARRDLLATFVASTAYWQPLITELYQSLLNREVTESELAQTGTVDEIRAILLASGEYFGQHNETGFASYVPAVFQSLLGRDPSESEQTSALGRLQSGTPLSTFVTSIGDWSRLTDAERQAPINTLLDREYTFNDEFVLDFSSREALISSILASDEFYGRFATPSNTTRVRTHATSDFASVGTIGDIGGGKAGGTLIAPQYVLVAAHSVAETPPGQITFTIGGVQHRIDDVILHPDYSPDLRGQEGANDIAILKLDQPVASIAPSLLTGRAPRLGEVLNLVGFGEEDGALFGTKRIGTTPPVSEVGASVFRWTHTSPTQNDSDPGDSGSPLFATIDGVPRIIGIVSGGTSSFNGLGDVATNTRADKYLDWIQSITGTLNATNGADAPSLLFESNQFFIDENDGPRTVAFIVSGEEPITFEVTTDKPEMFRSVSVDYDGRGEGDLVYETIVNQRGTANITVTARAGGLSVTQTVSVTVEERNDPPTIDEIPAQVLGLNPGPQSVRLTGLSAGLGETGNVQVTIADVSPIGFFASIGLSSASLGNARSGLAAASSADPMFLNFFPALGASGNATVTVEVRDDGGAANSRFQTLNITVTPNNRAPTVSNPSQNLRQALSGQSFTISYATLLAAVGGSDPDGDTLQLRIDQVPSGILTKNDAVVIAGVTSIGPNEALVWTPPANTNAVVAAFAVRSVDPSGVASATLASVSIDVATIARYLRTYSSTTDNHFFTMSQFEANYAVTALDFRDEITGNPGFAVATGPAPNTQPIYRLYLPLSHRHYYTANTFERDFLVGLGARYEKNEGFIFTQQVPGSTTVFHLYNTKSGSHLFTESLAQMNAILSRFQGIWVRHSDFGFAFPVTASGSLPVTAVVRRASATMEASGLIQNFTDSSVLAKTLPSVDNASTSLSQSGVDRGLIQSTPPRVASALSSAPVDGDHQLLPTGSLRRSTTPESRRFDQVDRFWQQLGEQLAEGIDLSNELDAVLIGQ